MCRPKWVQNIPSLQRLHTATDLLSAVADHNIQIDDDYDYGDGGWSKYYSLDHITQTYWFTFFIFKCQLHLQHMFNFGLIFKV